jgi:anti-sigma-K factor RskA
MTDHRSPDGADRELVAVETLLRELTREDLDRVEPAEDLWDHIESEIHRTRSGASVVAIDRHRPFWPRTVTLLAVAAAALVVVGTVAVLTQRGDHEPLVVAAADLVYDPVTFDELGAASHAHVSLLDDDGDFLVDVDDSELVPPRDDEDLELWLIQPDAEGNPADLVSLGLVDPDEPGTFDVPIAYDPDVYFVVDISVEPRDGDATHSGRSILRGALTSV